MPQSTHTLLEEIGVKEHLEIAGRDDKTLEISIEGLFVEMVQLSLHKYGAN